MVYISFSNDNKKVHKLIVNRHMLNCMTEFQPSNCFSQHDMKAISEKSDKNQLVVVCFCS